MLHCKIYQQELYNLENTKYKTTYLCQRTSAMISDNDMTKIRLYYRPLPRTDLKYYIFFINILVGELIHITQ